MEGGCGNSKKFGAGEDSEEKREEVWGRSRG